MFLPFPRDCEEQGGFAVGGLLLGKVCDKAYPCFSGGELRESGTRSGRKGRKEAGKMKRSRIAKVDHANEYHLSLILRRPTHDWQRKKNNGADGSHGAFLLSERQQAISMAHLDLNNLRTEELENIRYFDDGATRQPLDALGRHQHKFRRQNAVSGYFSVTSSCSCSRRHRRAFPCLPFVGQ